MKILAVDPGMSGAVVLLEPNTMHVRTDFKHPEDLTRAIEALAPSADVAVIELVASRPGQGVASMFQFGFSAGIAVGSLLYAGFSEFDQRRKPLIEVAPQLWQRYFRELPNSPCSTEFFDSPSVLRFFHPQAAEFLTRKKDHNTADALLMALWYLCVQPKLGSLRKQDRSRLKWLQKHFNTKEEKH